MPTKTIEISQLIADIEAEQERREWSNRAVARALDISPTTLSNWYAGMSPTLNADNMAGICEFLDIQPPEVVARLGWTDSSGQPVSSGESRPYLESVQIMPVMAA